MNTIFKASLVATVALGVTFAADPVAFEGTWKLNVAKSKFESPAKKAQTVTITKEGTTISETLNDGTERRWSYKAGDTKEVKITGLENSSVSFTQTGERTVAHTWRMGNETSTGQGVLSTNGKSMTYTLSGKTPDGKAFKDVLIFEKQ